jgi:hypothetical protein
LLLLERVEGFNVVGQGVDDLGAGVAGEGDVFVELDGSVEVGDGLAIARDSVAGFEVEVALGGAGAGDLLRSAGEVAVLGDGLGREGDNLQLEVKLPDPAEPLQGLWRGWRRRPLIDRRTYHWGRCLGWLRGRVRR